MSIMIQFNSKAARYIPGVDTWLFREMFIVSGKWYTGNDEDPMSVVFVVKSQDDDGSSISEEDTFRASVYAFLGLCSLYGADDGLTERMNSWVKARIRKIVKRAHGSKWKKVVEYSQEAKCDFPSARAVCEKAEVLCFAPMKASEQAKPIKQLQVSGLDLKREINNRIVPANTKSRVLTILLDEGLNMSSGKAIAQIGHAVQLAMRYMSDEAFETWATNGYQVRVERASSAELDGISRVVAEVRDAGFTEIDAGSRTAVALFT